MEVVEYEYVEINNISCIFSKMAAKMAAENQLWKKTITMIT